MRSIDFTKQKPAGCAIRIRRESRDGKIAGFPNEGGKNMDYALSTFIKTYCKLILFAYRSASWFDIYSHVMLVNFYHPSAKHIRISTAKSVYELVKLL